MSGNQPFSLASRLSLSNGASIPQIQLGLYQMSRTEAHKSVGWALSAGYRGFDCAQIYQNEREAGRAIREWLASPENLQGPRLTRKDIWYTTKLAHNSTDYDEVRASIRKSVKDSGLGYVDLFLLHSPYGGKWARLMSWKALEDAVDAGEVRMAGVSNFGVRHIEELMIAEPRMVPVVNQIEVHPFNTQFDIRDICERYGIVIEAYSPLVRGLRMRDGTIVHLAKKYHCSPAQLLVRWSLQNGMVTLPKSTKQARLLENANVGWFNISKEDMEEMDELDQNLVTDWDPTDAA